MAVGDTHVIPGFSLTSTNTTFLCKATDYFSHMLLQKFVYLENHNLSIKSVP